MKLCARCKTQKPIEEFLIDRRGYSDGRGSYCRDCRAAYHRDGRKLRPELYRKWERGKYARDREKILARQSVKDRTAAKERNRLIYAASPEVRAKVKAQRDAWRANNPDKMREQGLRSSKTRRARIKGSPVVRTITKAEILGQLEKQEGRCFYCHQAMEKPTLDHFYPLSRGGHHTIENIVLACEGCNKRKAAKDPHMFMSQREAA